MRINLKVPCRTVIQYFLIYLVLIYNGAVWFRNNQDVMMIVTLCMSTLFIITRIKKRWMWANIKSIFPIFLSMCLTNFLTKGSLSIGTILNVMSRFLLILFAYDWNAERFVERYVKTVVFVSGISIIMFTLQCINPLAIQLISQKMYHGTGTFYVTPFYTMSMWATNRNVGIMTEPGLYQILLCSAIYLILFLPKATQSLNRMRGLLILSIALITSQSTTGYLNLAILIIGFLVQRKDSPEKRKIKIIVTGLFIVAICVLSFGGNISFIQNTITSKLINPQTGRIDVSVSTGRARIISMLTDLILVRKYPLGCGFDIYNANWKGLLVEHIGDTASCAALTYSLAVFGFLTCMLIWRYYLKNLWNNRTSFFSFLSLLMVFVNTSLSQPLLYYPAFMVLFIVNENDLPRRQYEEYSRIDKK